MLKSQYVSLKVVDTDKVKDKVKIKNIYCLYYIEYSCIDVMGWNKYSTVAFSIPLSVVAIYIFFNMLDEARKTFFFIKIITVFNVMTS